MLMNKILGACLLASSAAATHAVPIVYQGVLTSGTTVTGSVSGFGWIDEIAADVDFWRFSGTAGDAVTITVTRTSFGLDPVFSLYRGVTGADGSLFLNDADWGGLQYLTFADDEVDHPGPGGDPSLVGYVLPATGNYTLALGGFQSTTAGPYGYSLSFMSQPIPEPSVAWLMAAGLLAVVRLGRRQQA